MEWPESSDALMFRDVQPGAWDVKRVQAHKIAAHLEGGWTVLLRSADMPPTLAPFTPALDEAA